MIELTNADARKAYYDAKRQLDEANKRIYSLERALKSKDERIEELRAGRKKFPEKFERVVQEALEANPTIKREDIFRSRGSAKLTSIRHWVWLEVLRRFPEESIADIGRAFGRSHSAIILVMKKYGFKR